MQVKLLICAYSVAIDQRSNTLSIFHVLEEINSPAFPYVIPIFSVVTHLIREPHEPAEVDGTRLLIQLGEQVVVDGPMPLRFQGRLRVRTVIDVQGVVVTAPGLLEVSVASGEQKLATWPITVNDIGRPAVQAELQLPQ